MSMVVKLSTNEAGIVATGLGMAITAVNEDIVRLVESDVNTETTVDTLMVALSVKLRAYGLYVPLWTALGMTTDQIAAAIAELEGE